MPVALPDLPGPFAVLMPGAGVAMKEWPVENYAALARHLAERRGLAVVVAGMPRDREKARRIGEISAWRSAT